MRRLMRLKKPAEHMEKYGVHPHVSHEIDVVAIVRDLAKCAERAAADVERGFDADVSTDWREYAKRLASRIKNQRREIDRLHKKVRELRADVHERDETIRARSTPPAPLRPNYTRSRDQFLSDGDT